MKTKNSYGSVELICSKKDKHKRSKPYRVRIVAEWIVDYDNLEVKPIRKTIGYTATKKEGEKLRDEYHNKLYDLDMKNVSFKYLFGMYFEYKKSKIKTYERYIYYAKFYEEIEKKPFNDITSEDLQRIVDEKMKDLSPEYQAKVISLYHEMREFAKAKNIDVRADASKLVNKKKNIQSYKHKAFTDEQIQLFWNNRDEIIDIVLCMIYCGTRPGEMLVISEVHDDYFISGSKTEAGKDRVIPIHNKIKDIFKTTYNSGILNNFKNSDNLYQVIKKRFKKLELSDFSPYDCRHTFATLAKRYKMDEHSRKLIMGHHIADLTDRVYTHKLIEELIEEVNKIDI